MQHLLPLYQVCRCRRRTILAAFLLLFLAAAVSPAATDRVFDEPSAPEKTVHEVLRAHGLPIGLLPRGVTEFRIDGEGRFEVRLESACKARFENEVHYDANVTGTLSYGQMGALKGMTAQELFLWFPVKGIRVDVPSSGLIYFDVGVIYKQFSLSLFETPPECTADPPASDGLLEGRQISLEIDKIKYGKLPYHLDQEDSQGKAIL